MRRYGPENPADAELYERGWQEAAAAGLYDDEDKHEFALDFVKGWNRGVAEARARTRIILEAMDEPGTPRWKLGLKLLNSDLDPHQAVEILSALPWGKKGMAAAPRKLSEFERAFPELVGKLDERQEPDEDGSVEDVLRRIRRLDQLDAKRKQSGEPS